MSSLTPDHAEARAQLELVFSKTYDLVLLTLTRLTAGDHAKAADLAEKVFVAAGHEYAHRTPGQWATWLRKTAGRVYDEDFLESCGVQP
ncbi:hypothetical protein EF903_06850 [Streptomyces sp. WAC05292]|uniref:hypothetical protein n=1 Tax=Streptomyces sp. WAC05292 TaxID=2487418 RepID=UPI000F748A4E|nr:hypothetical protein [Streptomyces sp. WAC05292]RSS94250.1 hypothetical protein EF903_06850 [Streptomyces sp. WAC05292]